MTAMPSTIENHAAFYANLEGAGEDLRYEADYMDLKSAISSGDFEPEQALSQCEALLARSKDWRLCAYALLCAAFAKNADKFMAMMQLFHDLVVQFYETSYPQSLIQKQSIVTWLNQSHVSQCIDDNDFLSLTLIETVAANLESIHQQLHEKMGDDVVLWTNLKQVFEKKKTSLQKPGTFKKVSDGIMQLVTKRSEEIDDPQAAMNDLKRIHTCFLNAQWLIKALNLSRVIRWSDIQRPVNENGKCTFPPVRKEDKQQLSQLLTKKQYQEAFIQSEKIFMQASGQFDLDIQRMVYAASVGMNNDDLSALIVSHVKYFLHRVPDVSTLHFNDTTPFCDDQTQGWLSQFAADDSSQAERDSHPFESVEQWIQAGDLNKVTQFIESHVTNDKLEAFWIDYLTLYQNFIAQDWQFCNIALSSLLKKVEQAALYGWSPSLTKKIWRLSHSILMRQKTSHGKPTALWQSQWDALQTHVTRFDLPFAAKLIHSSS